SMTQSPQRAPVASAPADTPPPGNDVPTPILAGQKTEPAQPAGPHAAPASTAEDREALESLPLPLVLQLEQACGRFEDAWQATGGGSTGPRIEDYLAPAPGRECPAPAEGADLPDRLHQALLPELVRIDIDYRRRAGQAPEAEEYLKRFPVLDR